MAEMSKVEEVARALCRQEGEYPDLPTPHHPTVKHLWEHYIPSARAAIEAMRPTSNRMDVAGYIHLRGNPSDASGCFEAMIDAALSEEVAG